MAANLCMVMDQGDKMKALLDDARANGIEILPPDINLSDWFFTAPDEKHIHFGLGHRRGDLPLLPERQYGRRLPV